jgi:hypothetical protein
MSDKVTITHVAIRFQGQIYSLPAPNRHHNVIRLIVDSTGVKAVDVRNDDQGFLDSTGRYLRRKPALRVAREAGQLRPDREVIGAELYSENLW